MNSKHKFATLTILVLLVATGYGLFRTRGQPDSATSGSSTDAGKQAGFVVDQSTFWTARWLAQMPTTAEERQVAEDALHMADKEMDLAFATAVREAEQHPPALSAQAKEIEARLQKTENSVAADQAKVEQLTAEVGKAKRNKQDELNDELNLAKAQLELDQDEVDDAKEDLGTAGGDQQARIQALTQEHDADSQISDNTHIVVTAPNEGRGLIQHFRHWSLLHWKQMQLWRAEAEAEAAAAMFSAKHNALVSEIGAQKKRSSEVSEPNSTGVSGNPASGENATGFSAQKSAAILQLAKIRSQDQKALVTFDKRADNQKQLASVYGKWIGIVAQKQRAVVNYVLRGTGVILLIALIGLFFDGWIESILKRMSMDRRQVETLRTVARVALQITAVLLILLVIFGPPTQLGTILGLAGAGLTVALKDFIVGFLGWFVLMGKNGIRLGDWVEINGVTGEVVELGMFHTVLLETGNWTDSGHPTGRRVTFTNSFAIEGHYFNFSTSGQWLWDELQVVLPTGQDPYPIVDAIQKKVLEATSEGARLAEQEWKIAARSRDMSALSAAPAINVKPVIGGVEIAVRYITRANERYQLRAKLYQTAVDLLGAKKAVHGGPPVAAATPK